MMRTIPSLNLDSVIKVKEIEVKKSQDRRFNKVLIWIVLHKEIKKILGFRQSADLKYTRPIAIKCVRREQQPTNQPTDRQRTDQQTH